MIVGVLVSMMNFLLASYFLYKWFVKGEGGIKNKVRQKISYIKGIAEQVKSYFVPGN